MLINRCRLRIDMRKIIYLALVLVFAIFAIEYIHKSNQSKTFVPSVLTAEIKDPDEDESKPISEYLSAAVSQRSGDFNKAIEYYQKSLTDNPDNTEIPKRLYGLYLYEGMYDEVLDLSNRNIEIDKAKKTPIDKVNPNPYLVVALGYFKKGEYRKVSQILAPIADPSIPDKSHVDGVVIPLILSWSYVLQGDYKASFDVIDNITTDYMLSVFSYNRALINDISNGMEVSIDGKKASIEDKAKALISEIFLEIGQYSMQSYNFDEAVIYFRLAEFLDGSSYKVKKMLATAFEAKGEYERVVKIYSNIVDEAGDENKEYTISKALALHKLERNDEAIKLLENLVGDEEFGYKSLVAIGSILMAEEKYKEAIEYFTKAEKKIEKFGKEHWTIYFNLGVSNDKLGNWDVAEANLKKAVELFPENPEGLNYLAYSWIVKNKNIKQARAMLEAAVVRSGGAPHILDSYGWALYKLGLYEDALPFLEQAALSLPYNSVINDHLGDLYWALNRHREARFQWNRAIFYYDKEAGSSEDLNLDAIKQKVEHGAR